MAWSDRNLEEALAADGWPYERLDATTWRSGFSAGGGRFRFFIRLAENWVYLIIIPFAGVPADSVAELALLRRLMHLNRAMTLAKFAIEGPDVVLTVELPRQDMTLGQLKDGLDAMTFYAANHHAEIAALLAEFA